jgi:hypothetical protein
MCLLFNIKKVLLPSIVWTLIWRIIKDPVFFKWKIEGLNNSFDKHNDISTYHCFNTKIT